MKVKPMTLMIALCLMLYTGLCIFHQQAWESDCTWVVAEDTPVYTPGAEDRIAVTLPAGTNCRVDESVGDTWQSIEYMIGGQTYSGMVQADALSQRSP